MAGQFFRRAGLGSRTDQRKEDLPPAPRGIFPWIRHIDAAYTMLRPMREKEPIRDGREAFQACESVTSAYAHLPRGSRQRQAKEAGHHRRTQVQGARTLRTGAHTSLLPPEDRRPHYRPVERKARAPR